MLIEHRLETTGDAASAQRRLVESLTEMGDLGRAAYRHGETLYADVGPIAKQVVVALGRPRITRTGLIVDVSWRATGAASLFPRLVGELEIDAVDDDITAWTLRGSYDSPLGSIGGILDRIVLARFVRITAASWLEQMAEALTVAPAITASVPQAVPAETSTPG